MDILPKDVLKLCFEKANLKYNDNHLITFYCKHCEFNCYLGNSVYAPYACNSCFYTIFTNRKGNKPEIEEKLAFLEQL